MLPPKQGDGIQYYKARLAQSDAARIVGAITLASRGRKKKKREEEVGVERRGKK